MHATHSLCRSVGGDSGAAAALQRSGEVRDDAVVRDGGWASSSNFGEFGTSYYNLFLICAAGFVGI